MGNRLTEMNDNGNWCLRGVQWQDLYSGSVLTDRISEILYTALGKLHDYEETGFLPEEIESLAETAAQKPQENDMPFPEKDRMGLVQALDCLHGFRDCFGSCGGSCQNIVEAFNVVFEFIEDVYLLMLKEKK